MASARFDVPRESRPLRAGLSRKRRGTPLRNPLLPKLRPRMDAIRTRARGRLSHRLDFLAPILQNTESHTQEHSLTTPIRAKISALGTYVPPKLLTNADLERMVDTTNDWILARVGIRERHIVEKGVATSDLAVAAAKQALAQRGLAPSDLDAIIVGTVTPDMFFPSTACLVQHKLGAQGAWGFDL